MQLQTAFEEYQKALKAGQKEQKECQTTGKGIGPLVLEQMLNKSEMHQMQYVGYVLGIASIVLLNI